MSLFWESSRFQRLSTVILSHTDTHSSGKYVSIDLHSKEVMLYSITCAAGGFYLHPYHKARGKSITFSISYLLPVWHEMIIGERVLVAWLLPYLLFHSILCMYAWCGCLMGIQSHDIDHILLRSTSSFSLPRLVMAIPQHRNILLIGYVFKHHSSNGRT